MAQSAHDVILEAEDYQGNKTHAKTLTLEPGADTTQDPEKRNKNIRWVVRENGGTKRFESKKQVKTHYERYGYNVKIK